MSLIDDANRLALCCVMLCTNLELLLNNRTWRESSSIHNHVKISCENKQLVDVLSCEDKPLVTRRIHHSLGILMRIPKGDRTVMISPWHPSAALMVFRTLDCLVGIMAHSYDAACLLYFHM